MNRLFRYFVERSFLVNLVSLFIVIIGLFSFSSMKRDLIPAWEWPQILVTAQIPGASSAEIEKFLTYPLEESLQGLPGVDYIYSRSSNGQTSISIHYPFGSGDLEKQKSDIESRVQSARSMLPPDTEDLLVQKMSTTESFLFAANLTGFDATKEEHRLALRKYKEGLRQVPGVVRVTDSSPGEAIFVEVNWKKASSYGLSSLDLQSEIRKKLSFTPVGTYEKGDSKIFIEIDQTLTTLDQIRNIPIRSTKTAGEILLGDIAKVEFRNRKVESLTRFNGKPSVSVRAFKSVDADVLELDERIAEYNTTFNENAPEGLKFELWVDGAYFIKKQLQILSSNGWIGLGIVILMLILLLNWRTSVIVAVGVPVAYLGTLALLHSLGIAFDLFSVVGLIIVLGMLVDDAIIVSEKYNENLELGLTPKDAATSAAKQLFIPVTGAILTTIVAFLPILMVESWVSIIFYSTPVIVIAALSLSLIESFLILPNHSAHYITKPQINRSTHFFNGLKEKYVHYGHKLLRFRYLTLIFSLLVLVGAGYVAATKLKHNFNLHIDVVTLKVKVDLEESKSLESSATQIAELEQDLLKLQETDSRIESLETQIGEIWRYGKLSRDYKLVELTLTLDRHSDDPDGLKEEVKKDLESIIEKHKDSYAKLSLDEAYAGKNDAKDDTIRLDIQGKDEVGFYELEQMLAASLEHGEYKILKELVPSEGYQDSWRFIPDEKALLDQGISIQNLASQAKSRFFPDRLGEVRFGGQSLSVYLEAEDEKEYSFSDLSRLPVVNRIGESIPSSFVGRWEETKVASQITHSDLRKSISIDFRYNSEEGNELKAKEELAALIKPFQEKYNTMKIEVEDATKEEAEAKDWSLKIALICITAVLFILALTLNSLTLPFLAATPIPFGLASIIFALYLHDLELGIMAIIGLVGTVGVCVNASLIMVDEVNRLSAVSGGWSHDTIVKGASKRIRAIVISILTTLGGVAPMAYGLGGDSSFLKPLAFSIFWGLLAATIVTLVFLPSFMAIYLDIRRFGGWVTRKSLKKLPIVRLKKDEPAQEQAHKASNLTSL